MKLFTHILLSLLFFSCSSDKEESNIVYRTYRYQIINSTDKDINMISFYSYEKQSEASDSDRELINTGLKIGEQTKEYKTKYPYVNFEYLYYLNSWVSNEPILRNAIFPSKNVFYELKKTNLILLK